jgi:hypothetical protein
MHDTGWQYSGDARPDRGYHPERRTITFTRMMSAIELSRFVRAESALFPGQEKPALVEIQRFTNEAGHHTEYRFTFARCLDSGD